VEFVGDEVPTPRWAVHDVWPEGASGVIAGRPKDGKSTLAVELAVSLWSGTPKFGLPEFPSQPRGTDDEAATERYANVLYVQQENSTQRVQRDLHEVLRARGLGSFVVDAYHSAEEIREAGFRAEEDYVLRHFEVELPNWCDDTRLDVLSQRGLDLSVTGHRAALAGLIEANRYDYVFLDPLYMLIGAVDEKDSGPLKPILTYLSGLRDAYGCGVILTHHMTDKAGARNEASRMLGSTYIHAWYEAALLVQRDGRSFEVKVDAQRSHGLTKAHTLTGRGVGLWHYDPAAQDLEDSEGRASPSMRRAEARVGLLAALTEEHPEWTDADHARELGVTDRTVRRYRKQLAEREALDIAVSLPT
jgi:hypothetical protein